MPASAKKTLVKKIYIYFLTSFLAGRKFVSEKFCHILIHGEIYIENQLPDLTLYEGEILKAYISSFKNIFEF